MPDIVLMGIVFALLLAISLASSEKRRRGVTILVAFGAIASSYLLGLLVPGMENAVYFAGCFAVAFASLETGAFLLFAGTSALSSAAFLFFGTPAAVVCAGFTLALASRYVAEWAVGKLGKRLPERFFYSAYRKPVGAMADEKSGLFEYRRKGFHFFGGMIMLAMIHFLGKDSSVLLFSAAALASLFVINSIAVRGRSFFEPLIELFERHGKRPMDGVLWFLMGAVSLLLFAKQMEFVFAGVFVMAAGDAAAAIFGKKFGSVKWPYNKRKSVAGTLAFAVCSLPALLFGGSIVVSLAIVACALLESLNWSLDDNIIAAIVFVVASYA